MVDAPRISLVTDELAGPPAQAVFERARSGFGFVPNLYRALAHAPELLEAWIAFAWPLRRDAVTPRALRELVIIRVAHLLGNEYEANAHRPMARQAGCSEESVDHLAEWRNAPSGTYDAGTRAALAVADRIACGQPVSAAEWRAFAAAFDQRAQVEVVLTAAFYVMVGRVIDTFAVPLDHDLPDRVIGTD